MSRTSPSSPPPRHEAERLHDAFGEVAEALAPSPVPLAAIERAGRARRRLRAAGLAVGCGLLLLPLVSVTVRAVSPAPVPPVREGVAAHPSPPDVPAVAPVRVVAPGEHVRAGAGVEIWLTEEGTHWSTPEMDHQFRSVVDGNIDLRHPGVGLNTEILGDRYFLSGVYTGGDHARYVVVSTSDGEVTAPLVRLPGSPGWGAWYTDVPLHDDLTIDRVSLFDEHGKEIGTLVPSRP
ncbi:hypothetical protein [Streptomyces sp. NPDC086010]|uniref:hypothetical protein n=1 Tax=Streptomyces sp. NPDC086010 TaxID=3365745 RepID=UPI0037D4F413